MQNFVRAHTACRPFHLKLGLKGKFSSITNETLENKETGEQLIVQKVLLPKSAPITVNGFTFEVDICYSCTEISVTRQPLAAILDSKESGSKA